MMATLYCDQKGLWRVKFDSSDTHAKGIAVPAGIRDLLDKARHHEKQCNVEMVNGQIVSLSVGEETFSVSFNVGHMHLPVRTRENAHSTVPAAQAQNTAEHDIDFHGKCEQVAWQCAKRGASSGKKDYTNAVKGLQMMIRTNGLGASLAFIGKHKKKSNLKHYRLLCDHLCRRLKALEPLLAGDNGELAENFRSRLDSSKTRALTLETLVFLGWLSRFSEGLTV
jgi:CRISPR-associated protein Cmr5